MTIAFPGPWRAAPPRSWHRRLAVATLVASPFCGSRASGQAAPPDSALRQPVALELVYSASRYAQESREAPASVTIVTAKEIREYGYRTLSDLLGAVRGFSMRNDLNYEYATVRGLASPGDFNTRILVMLDGQRLNGPVTDASAVGTDALIDLDRIARVEIIRGPGSALFGTNAFSGVINIVTDRRVGANGGARAEAEVGSFGTYRASAAWSTTPGARLDVMVGTSAQRRTGLDRYDASFDTPENNNGVAERSDGDESARLVTKVRAGSWSFQGAAARRLSMVPTASYGTVFNARALRTTDQSAVGTLAYNRVFNDLSRVSLAVGANHSAYRGTYPYDGYTFRDSDHGNQFMLEAQYVRVVGQGHTLAVGAEGRLARDGRLGTEEEPVGSIAVATVSPRFSQRVGALYTQAEWKLGDRALLYTGVRHDQYEQVGGTTNPRLALLLRPAEPTTVKLLYGAAFRAPNFFERFYEDGGVTQKAPESLAPETVRTIEIEIEHRLGGVTGSVSAYRLATSSLINLTTDSTDNLLLFRNVGSPSSQGLEVELRGRVGRVSGRGSVSVQDAVDEEQVRLVDSPTRLARLGLSVPMLRDRTNVAVELRHVGARRTQRDGEAPAYTLTHATWLLRSTSQRVELLLSIKDLFNAGHVDPAGPEHLQRVLTQDGRSVRLGLRATF